MKMGIIGLPLTGKSKFFHFLTDLDAKEKLSGGRKRFGTAIVPDPGIERLTNIFELELIQ